ncbi:MAG: hypothetical protein K8R85_00670 [Bacteroidetes bacterium]|nr:hypothetical protein [Bacteroidota bacterium]
MGRKRTIEFIQLHIQLEEMIILKKKLEILKIRKSDVSNGKLFSISLSPIQSLLIITYANVFIKNQNDSFTYQQVREYQEVLRKGFNFDNYFIPPCTCGKCEVLEGNALLEKQQEIHNQIMKSLREQTIVNIMHTLFETSIAIAAIYYYITLTLNN